MALGVMIYCRDGGDDMVPIGYLYLDGDRVRASDPSDPTLKDILARPAAGPKSGGRPVRAGTDPFLFLSCLASTYRGIARRAGTLQEITRPDG